MFNKVKNMVFLVKKYNKKHCRVKDLEQFTICIDWKKTDKLNQRQDRYNKKKYEKKWKRLRENLNIGEKLYVLAEKIKKKSAPGKFLQTISAEHKLL